MNNTTYTSYQPKAGSYSLLKKDINKQAADAGFSPEKLEELELIVSEMTSNLLKYSQTGELRMCIAEIKNKAYLELICIDSAPDVADEAKQMISEDPSANSSQKGLDCIRKLSDYFEFYKMIGWGSILICRIYKNSKF